MVYKVENGEVGKYKGGQSINFRCEGYIEGTTQGTFSDIVNDFVRIWCWHDKLVKGCEPARRQSIGEERSRESGMKRFLGIYTMQMIKYFVDED